MSTAPLASDLVKPHGAYRGALVASLAGIAWAPVSSLVFPANPTAAAATALAGLAAAGFAWSKLRKYQEERQELEKDRRFVIETFPVKESQYFLGKGYMVDQRHAQAWYDLLGENLDELHFPEGVGGDPRIYGLGGMEASDWFLPLKALNEMLVVLGSTGVGKTRFIEPLAVQAVRDAMAPAVVYVDPKGDDGMRNRLAEEARKTGRPFLWFSLAHPEMSDTYNPLLRHSTPYELQGRIGSLIPENKKDPHWHATPTGTATTVAVAFHWISEYLGALGGVDEQAPEVMRELNNGEISPEYAPDFWIPRLSELYHWGVIQPQVLLAWMLRIRYPWAFDDEATTPRLAKQEHRDKMVDLWDSLSREKPSEERGEIWRRHLRQADRDRMRRAAEGMGEVFREVSALLKDSSDDRVRNNNSLRTGMDRLRTVRSTVNAAKPTIRWDDIIRSGAILMIELNSMKDGIAASMVGKAMLSDLCSYLGDVYASGKKGRPVFMFVDEVSCVACQPLIDLINKGRGGGLHGCIMGQGTEDLTAALGDTHQAKQILQNMNSIIQLRTNSKEDAKAFSERAGEVRIGEVSKGASTNANYEPTAGTPLVKVFSSTGSVNYQSRRTNKVPPSSVMALPTGQAFVYTGGRTFVMQAGMMPPPCTAFLEERRLLRPPNPTKEATDDAAEVS